MTVRPNPSDNSIRTLPRCTAAPAALRRRGRGEADTPGVTFWSRYSKCKRHWQSSALYRILPNIRIKCQNPRTKTPKHFQEKPSYSRHLAVSPRFYIMFNSFNIVEAVSECPLNIRRYFRDFLPGQFLPAFFFHVNPGRLPPPRPPPLPPLVVITPFHRDDR
jgi:hypothetical protein